MKSYAKFYNPNHPNSCKHPTQTDCTAVKATLRHSGFRAGEVRASSHTKNVNFIVGWGGGGGEKTCENHWRPSLDSSAGNVGRDNRSRNGDGGIHVERGETRDWCCCLVFAAAWWGFFHARIRNLPPCDRYSFSKGRSLGKWRLKH